MHSIRVVVDTLIPIPGKRRFWLQVSEIQNLLAYKAHPDGKDIFSNDGGETPNLSD
jgi:hypothetical protein